MDFAFKKFIEQGISRITMDDIAKGVGMGKGTLYKYFPSKEALILHTIDFITNQIENELDNVLADEKLTMVQKLNLFLKTVTGKLAKINPDTLQYLDRSMPEAYKKIEQIRERIIYKNLVRIFEDGKKNGLFESDIDEWLVAHMMIGSVNHILSSYLLMNTEYSFDKLCTSLINILMKGCLTEEGRKN